MGGEFDDFGAAVIVDELELVDVILGTANCRTTSCQTRSTFELATQHQQHIHDGFISTRV